MFSEYSVTPELVDLVPLKVVALSRDGYYTYVNRTFCQWFGCERKDVIGKHVTEVLDVIQTPVDILDRGKFVQTLADDGGQRDYEATMRHPDGSRRHVMLRALGLNGGVVCFFRDVTDARNSQENEARLRAVVETAGEGVIVINSQVIIQSFNAAAEKQFGYKAEEVIGRNLKELMPERYARDHDEKVARYVNGGEAHIVGKGSVPAAGRRKDGTEFPCEIAIAEFEVGGEMFFTGIIRDVSERVNHEATLREMNDNLEAEVQKRGRALDQIFNLSDDILGIMDFEGCFLSASPSAAALTGIPVATAIGSRIPYDQFCVEEDREGLRDIFARVIQGEQITAYEFRVRHVDGGFKWTSWNIRPVLEDRVILLVGRDVTADKLRDEQLRQSQKMEAIGQLTGGIAHDFNNLLMAISGCLDLINRKLPDECKADVTRYMEGAQSSTKRAAALTHRLLAFSRRQPLAPVPVNVNKLTEGMRDLITRTIGPQVEVITTLNDVGIIQGDPHQLENGLLNLIINARDAMTDGAGRVVIETSDVEPDECGPLGLPVGEYVRISVTDDGGGMSEATMARAFDPFFTTKAIGHGTGLGLSMLYGFVSQSEGFVKLNSKEGKGTTVSLDFPRTEGGIVATAVSEKAETQHVEGKTVLLVEDEEVVRVLIRDILTGVGYNVIDTPEGNAALKVVSSDQEIDMMITDVGLPGMTGKQVAQAARKVRPDLRVLFVTGYAAGVTIRSDLLESGTDMLLKPFTMDSLLAKVAEIIGMDSTPEQKVA